jgi:hypothetical protein
MECSILFAEQTSLRLLSIQRQHNGESASALPYLSFCAPSHVRPKLVALQSRKVRRSSGAGGSALEAEREEIADHADYGNHHERQEQPSLAITEFGEQAREIRQGRSGSNCLPVCPACDSSERVVKGARGGLDSDGYVRIVRGAFCDEHSLI